MSIILTWNIFVISCLSLIITYSIIIERHRILSLIIATFISVMVSDAIHNIATMHILNLPGVVPYVEIFTVMGIPSPAYKVLLFLLILVGLTRSQMLHIDTEPLPTSVEIILSAILGLLSGCMLISIILIYFGGGSFLLVSPENTLTFIAEIRKESFMVNILMQYYQLWFLLPLLAFIPWNITLTSNK
jgi:hypothetical protein